MFLILNEKLWLNACRICGEEKIVSNAIGVCKDCIMTRFDEAKEIIDNAHEKARAIFSLPPKPPRNKNGIPCNICANNCIIGQGEIGYCGLRKNVGGKLVSLSTPNYAPLYAYLDPHITNCCAAWFCPAATGLGYPKYAVSEKGERGYYNLAVFFYGCNFSCLFCQNWDHKNIEQGKIVKSKDLVNHVLANDKITCICYFGGSPEPHLPFIINVNKMILKNKAEERIIRICYEWNGAGNPVLVRKAAEQALVSGGIIKFDLKAFSPELNYALCGVSNEVAYDNFKMIYDEFWRDRPEVPLLTATTLLVPGYIDADEVEKIARFIASIDRNIPYSLLVFHPDFRMKDLPITPRKEAYKALERAKKYLRNVYLGNRFLLNMAPPKL